MKSRILLILVFSIIFLLITQNKSLAAVFKIELPGLLGEHDVFGERLKFTNIFVNVNAGPPFQGVKSATLLLKGTSIPNEFVSENDSTKIFFAQTILEVSIREPCKPRFVLKRARNGKEIGPLTEQFENTCEFSTDASFLNRGEANFKLIIQTCPYTWPGKLGIYDKAAGKFVGGFRTKLTKSGIVDIKVAYLLIEADSQSNENEIFSTELPTSKILFDVYHINYAWGFVLSGFFINEEGNIFKYDNSCGTGRDLPYGEFTHKEFSKKFGYTKLVDRVDKDTLMKYFSLVEEVSHGEIKRSSRGADMGQSVNAAYVFSEKTGKYKEVQISSRGDWNEINTSDAAAKITKWLEEIRKRLENK